MPVRQWRPSSRRLPVVTGDTAFAGLNDFAQAHPGVLEVSVGEREARRALQSSMTCMGEV